MPLAPAHARDSTSTLLNAQLQQKQQGLVSNGNKGNQVWSASSARGSASGTLENTISG